MTLRALGEVYKMIDKFYLGVKCFLHKCEGPSSPSMHRTLGTAAVPGKQRQEHA